MHGAEDLRRKTTAAVLAVCDAVPEEGPMWVDQTRAVDGALDDAQLAAVVQLRSMITVAREKWLSRPPSDESVASGHAVVAEADAHTDDFTLHRFIVSRPESLDAAFEMFSQAMEWRATRGVSSLFVELHPRAADASGGRSPRHATARSLFYGGFGGFTRDGRPYFIERLGVADLAGYSRHPGAREIVVDAYIAHLETIFRCVRAHSAAAGKFTRCTIVIDCAGLSFSTLTHIGLVKAVSKIGPPNFPEGSQQVVVVNAPVVISAAWALVSPLLPARTRAKVAISSSWATRSVLRELIDDAQLPPFLGGSKAEGLDLIGGAEPVPHNWTPPPAPSVSTLDDSMVSVSLGD